MFKHFYSRYGLAVTMLSNKLENPEEVKAEMLIRELQDGQNHFRLEPRLEPFLFIENGKVKFQYLNKSFFEDNPQIIGSQGKKVIDIGKGKAEISFYLSPTIITSNKGAKNAWQGVAEIIKELEKNSDISNAKAEAKMSIFPTSGKINNGKKSQSNPRSSLFEIACGAITTFTDKKPAMLVENAEPACILPDLEINDLQKFIALFEKMKESETKNLFLGKVKESRKENVTLFTFQRPKICNGNFPYAPRQSILGSAGLLGAIGRWAKRANSSKEGNEVLESLKSRPMYIVTYGDASTVMYDEWVIELAKNDNLCDVIDALERTEILSEEKQDYNSPKFQTFLLFASRFLQLFDENSLQDFLSVRAEYLKEIEKLFNTFFEKIMKKDKKIVQSARALGAWLNRTAYFAAKEEAQARQKNDSETERKLKAKFLAEMESTVLSAKSHHALLAQVITRAGRLSYSDAPSEATLFIDTVAAEQINIDEAKNLIIAYSRIKSVSKTDDDTSNNQVEDTIDDIDKDLKDEDESE